MTPSAPLEAADTQDSAAFSQRLLIYLVAASLAVGLARRTLVGWDAPLWLDEAFTGAIAIQPSFSGLVQDCLNELGGPVYYSLIWVWEKLAGASNVSLRLPSLTFSLAAPLLIYWKGHPDRTTRILWAALAAIWLPAFGFANEARPYSLLFFLAAGQLILFLRLLEDPSRRSGLGWASVSALMILTHYHALVITGLQGLAFLTLRRRDALATWPATLVFVPVIAWMAFHLPVHIRFSSPDVAWHQLLSPRALKAFPDLMLAAGRFAAILFLIVAVTLAFDFVRAASRKSRLPYSINDMTAVGMSLVAIVFVYGLGFIRPSFVTRYLVPFMPGFLLGLAIWLRVWGKRVPILPCVVILPLLWLAAAGLVERMRNPRIDPRWDFTWQAAAEDIRRSGATGLIFFWDNPTTALGYPEILRRTGGFFFDRAEVPIATRELVLAGKGEVDPNIALLQMARPQDAIIWAYDKSVPHTLAVRHPPMLASTDPRWSCRNFGRFNISVLSCTRSK